jgi:hypothetical protein
MPIVYLVTILPISIGGLGVREGTLVMILSFVNIETSEAVILSFLIYLNRILIGGVGGIIQLSSILINT